VPRAPVEPEAWRQLAAYLTSNVRALRAQAGWTQAETAERANIDAKHMQSIEAGSGNVTLRVLAALAAAFGVTPARLLEPAPIASPRPRGRPPKRFVTSVDVEHVASSLHDPGAPRYTPTPLHPRKPKR
jgi:transcriptional regulator with XRE-family HTH domain